MMKNLVTLVCLMAIFLTMPLQNLTSQENTHAFTVEKNVLWAMPDSLALTMDIYTPLTGKPSYPVIIIYHGGGWLINTNAMMDSMAIYLSSHAEYVVCNVNYRLLGDHNNTVQMNQIVEDATGAAIWVSEHIAAYKGNSSQIIVTGDSAGGHLAAMVMLCCCPKDISPIATSFPNFWPTGLTPDKNQYDILQQTGSQIKAAVLSYPDLDVHKTCVLGFETVLNPFWSMANVKGRGIFGDTITVRTHPELYESLSPINNIPPVSERLLPPQLVMVGTRDIVVPPSWTRKYVTMCREAGQPIEFWEYKGKPHAFLDAIHNPLMGNVFHRDAPLALNQMILFLDNIFFSPSQALTFPGN